MAKQKTLIDEYGDSVFVSAKTILDDPKQVISTTPKADNMLGGGIPEGSMVIITGPPKCGKTTFALTFAANCQKEQFGGRKIIYDNIEHRLKKRDLEGISGLILEPDFFEIIQSSKDKILSAENHIHILESKIHTEPNSVFIIDSFSALCTQERMDADLGKRFMDNTPGLLSMFCKRINAVLRLQNSIVIGITHLIANQNPMSRKSWVEASGRKIQYESDVKLRFTHFDPWKDGEDVIGQNCHVVCETSAVGPPLKEAELKLRYGMGMDKYTELIEMASALSIVKKGGAWYTFPSGEKKQGLIAASRHLFENEEEYDSIYAQYKELLGFDESV